MAFSIETLQFSGDDRLAVLGVGVDFPGCQDWNDFYQGIYTAADLTQQLLRPEGQQSLRPEGQQQAGWKAFGCLKRAAESAMRTADSPDMGLLLFGPAGEQTRVRGLVSGPVVDFNGSSEPLPAMLAQAHAWLAEGKVRAVLVAGANFAVTAGAQPPVFGFDQTAQGNRPASGAVAVVLMRLGDARDRHLPVLAVLDALAYHHGSAAPDGQAVQICAETALKLSGVDPAQVGLVDAVASGETALDEAEIRGLAAAYRGASPTTLLSSVRAQTGWLEGVNGLAALAHAVVCLVYRVRPGVRGWSGPKFASLWAGSAFYVLPESLTWFQPSGPAPRRAGVNFLARDGSGGHLLLSEVAELLPAQPAMREAGQVMLMAGGACAADVIGVLEEHRKYLEAGQPLVALAQQAYVQYQATAPQQVAVILAHNPAEALRELDFALRGLPTAAEKGSEWQTPVGSYYTPRPLGAEGRVAFVYPGAFNSYLGAGKDLFALFPGLHDRLAQIAPAGAVLYEERLYPRSLTPLAKEQLDRLEAALLDDAFAMMSSGLSLSVVETMIFRDIFQLHPESAFGYSLGENSMLFAMGVWGQGVAMSRRLQDSELFHTRLAGPQNAVREYWGLPAQTAARAGEELWGNFLVMAAVERVEQALVGEERVYMTHINTPRQVVIAGDPAACRRVIEKLKCSSLRAPFNYVLHCQAMESEYDALYDLHRWPVREKPAALLYSAADDRPFQWNEADVARATARDLCSRLDFPRLIETAYAGGARIFLELGAGSNCSKWIEDTLRGRSFLSMSANRKGVDDTSAILRVLARLASHRAAVNLDPLFALQVKSYA